MHPSVVILGCLVLYLLGCDAAFGPREDFTIPWKDPDDYIGSFIFLEQDDVIIASAGFGTKLVVISAGPEMKVLHETFAQCGVTYPWIVNELIPHDSSSGTFFINCLWLPDLSHAYNNVTLARWDGQKIVQPLNAISISPLGSLYNHVAAADDSPYVYLYTGLPVPSQNCKYFQLDTHSKQWAEGSISIDGYSYATEAGHFIDPAGKYIITNALNKDNTWTTVKALLHSGQPVATLEPLLNSSDLYNAYSLFDYSTGTGFLLEIPASHLYAYFSLVDYNTMERLQVMEVRYSGWTVYGGLDGWNGFGAKDGFAYLHMEIDDGPDRVHQIQFSTSPPTLTLLDSIDFNYGYSHNIIATKGWLYIDTDSLVLSRWSIPS